MGVSLVGPFGKTGVSDTEFYMGRGHGHQVSSVPAKRRANESQHYGSARPGQVSRVIFGFGKKKAPMVGLRLVVVGQPGVELVNINFNFNMKYT